MFAYFRAYIYIPLNPVIFSFAYTRLALFHTPKKISRERCSVLVVQLGRAIIACLKLECFLVKFTYLYSRRLAL